MVTAPASRYPNWFARRLAECLDRQGLSVRAVAKRLNPDRPEIARRSLQRYVAGRIPGAARRAEIARALGLPDDALEPSADDEDSDLFEAAHRLDLAGDYALANRLRARARQSARTRSPV